VAPGLTTADLVEAGDLDELTRHVDRLSSAREWDGLLDLRDRCRRAFERGRQLWPAAAHAEYRLALEAPGRWAGQVLEPSAGRFALGPLSEVAASTHTWAELAPHAPAGPVAARAAHERVVRGEDLRADAHVGALPPVLDVPLALAAWEPAYPLATYEADKAHFGDVAAPRLHEVALPSASGVERRHDPDGCRALLDLTVAWVVESNGTSEAVAVVGDARGALAALGATEARAAEVPPADALALMAWTAASGGAHGRRRGMAPGRFAAWWTVAALAGLLDEWPAPPDDVGDAAHDLRWYRWDDGAPGRGWSLRLAVEDPSEGWAWAVAATDQRS
jgi:hypothetical protein